MLVEGTKHGGVLPGHRPGPVGVSAGFGNDRLSSRAVIPPVCVYKRLLIKSLEK